MPALVSQQGERRALEGWGYYDPQPWLLLLKLGTLCGFIWAYLPRTQIVLSLLAPSWAWAAAFCHLQYGRGHPVLVRGRLDGRGRGETKKTTALLPRFLPPAWPGLVFPGSSWTAGLSGSYVCRPDLACVLGRCCLCACHWPPEPSCSPGSVTLKMMSGFWGFHFFHGRYLLDSPQPWLWTPTMVFVGVSSVSTG